MTENYSLWSRKLEGKKSSIFAATMHLDPWRFLARRIGVVFSYHYLLIYKYRKYKEFFALCPNFARISAVCLLEANVYTLLCSDTSWGGS